MIFKIKSNQTSQQNKGLHYELSIVFYILNLSYTASLLYFILFKSVKSDRKNIIFKAFLLLLLIEYGLDFIYALQLYINNNLSLFNLIPEEISLCLLGFNFLLLFVIFIISSIKFGSSQPYFPLKIIYSYAKHIALTVLLIFFILFLFENVLFLYNPEVSIKDKAFPFNLNLSIYVISNYIYQFIKYIPFIFSFLNQTYKSLIVICLLKFLTSMCGYIIYRLDDDLLNSHKIFEYGEMVRVCREALVLLIVLLIFMKNTYRNKNEDSNNHLQENESNLI